MVHHWLKTIQNSLPSYCILCDANGLQGKDICQYCQQQILRNNSACVQCGKPMKKVNDICEDCFQTPKLFANTHAPYLYQGIMRYLILQLKFQRQYKNARLLANLFTDTLQIQTELPEVIIPMPLHRQRYQQRGFNQSLIIAQHISKHLKIPINSNACVRHKDTLQQLNLNANQRLQNVSNAFSIQHNLNYKSVAVLDDVMTTGATANAITQTLKQAGVKQVDIWVCARA